MITTGELQKDTIPEVIAAVLVCRVFLKTATAEELQTFFNNNNLNCELFYDIVRAHSIRPIVNKVIAEVNINEEVKQRLRADCKRLALKNFEHYRELLRLNNLFKIACILAVPYKGCIFSLRFYNDISLREFSDLDFLIHPGTPDVRAIMKIMEKEGYTVTFGAPGEFEEFYFSHIREFKFVFYVSGQRKFLAEFHSSLNDPVFETTAPVPNEYLFNDLKEEILSGSKIQLLSPTVHFIAMLTHHGIREQWTSLKNLMDLAMVLKSSETDWPLIDACSHTYKFEKVLAIGLGMAEYLFGLSPVKPYSRPQNSAPWLKKLCSKHLYKTDRTWRYNFLLKLRSKDTAGDKYKMIWQHIRYLATPSLLDYKFIKLPKALFFLYVVVKPVRMMWRKGSKDK